MDSESRNPHLEMILNLFEFHRPANVSVVLKTVHTQHRMTGLVSIDKFKIEH